MHVAGQEDVPIQCPSLNVLEQMHPELLTKIISTVFRYMHLSLRGTKEFRMYHQQNPEHIFRCVAASFVAPSSFSTMSTQLSMPNLLASTHQSSTPLFLLSRPRTSSPVKEYSTSKDPTKPLTSTPNVSYSSSSLKLHARFNSTTGLGSRLPAPAPPALAPWPGTPRHHRTQTCVRCNRTVQFIQDQVRLSPLTR